MVAQPCASASRSSRVCKGLVNDIHDDLEAAQPVRVDGNAVHIRGHAHGGGVHQDGGGAIPHGVQGDGFAPQIFD